MSEDLLDRELEKRVSERVEREDRRHEASRAPNIAGMLDALAPFLSRVELHADNAQVEVAIGKRRIAFAREIGEGEHDYANVLMQTLLDAAHGLNTSAEMTGERRIPTDHRRPALEVHAALVRLVEMLEVGGIKYCGLPVAEHDVFLAAKTTLEKYGARV